MANHEKHARAEVARLMAWLPNDGKYHEVWDNETKETVQAALNYDRLNGSYVVLVLPAGVTQAEGAIPNRLALTYGAERLRPVPQKMPAPVSPDPLAWLPDDGEFHNALHGPNHNPVRVKREPRVDCNGKDYEALIFENFGSLGEMVYDLKSNAKHLYPAKTHWPAELGHPARETIGREAADQLKAAGQFDTVNRPKHYNAHPSGIECIEVTRHMGFNLGNAIKYLWRADLKGGIEDLEKAQWYINDEIAKRKKASGS